MHQEITVHISELRYASFECAHCKAVVTLDLENQQPDLGDCPACHRQYQPSVEQNLRDLARAFMRSKDGGGVWFRIPVKA